MSNLILIVEDNALVRQVLALELSEAGYEVVEAGDGAEALRIASIRIPSVILTDIEMPIMDGRNSVRAMRGNPALSLVPIVALTGMQSSVPDDEKLFDAVLIKPLIPREVVALVARMLQPAPSAVT